MTAAQAHAEAQTLTKVQQSTDAKPLAVQTDVAGIRRIKATRTRDEIRTGLFLITKKPTRKVVTVIFCMILSFFY